jgi:uncharacterized protein
MRDDKNDANNRVVWLDIPVSDLNRAMHFYRHVLNITIDKIPFAGMEFAIFEHDKGNGACLVPDTESISAKGPLAYLNADGRIKEAVKQTQRCGGSIIQDIHPIGEYGYRAIILDSEGNRVALHAMQDL